MSRVADQGGKMKNIKVKREWTYLKIDNEMISPFDVDETLVLDRKVTTKNVHHIIDIFDPALGEYVQRIPHKKQIELLKRMHGRGRFIVVWSGNGADWADSVVRTLGLKPYVHIACAKPICYVDDYPASQWLNNHIYLKPEET
jgi:predicted phosphatase